MQIFKLVFQVNNKKKRQIEFVENYTPQQMLRNDNFPQFPCPHSSIFSSPLVASRSNQKQVDFLRLIFHLHPTYFPFEQPACIERGGEKPEIGPK